MEEIKQLYKMKSEFTSTVSHELRTPLTAICEGINLVLDGSAGQINGEQKEFLGIAQRNVDRLTRLVNYVLDFSKLTSNRGRFSKEKVIINKVISSVTNIYQLVIDKKGLTLKTDLESTKDFEVEIDPDRINQVITNLLSNAVKFTDRGQITVGTKKEEDTNFIIIFIQDTGIGISQEDTPNLFQPFTQVGEGNGGKSGGAGWV